MRVSSAVSRECQTWDRISSRETLRPAHAGARVEAHLAAAQVGLTPAEAQARGRTRALGTAAQHGFHARQQLAQPEGLDDVVIGAQPQPAHAVVLLAAGRQHDHGTARAGQTHLPQDLETVDAGQHEVEQQQVAVAREALLETGVAVRGLHHVEALKTQRVDQATPDRRVVFDHQHAFGHARPQPARSEGRARGDTRYRAYGGPAQGARAARGYCLLT